MMLKVLTVVLLSSFAVRAIRITNHLIEVDHEGHRVAMDITRDTERNTLLAIIGDISKYGNGRQTVNLHDFNTNYGVLKDINEKVCLLGRSTLSKTPTPEMYTMGVTHEVHYHDLDIEQNEMAKEDVAKLAGPNIASFCSDYATFFVTAIPAKKGTKVAKMSGGRRKCWCVWTKCSC